MRQLLVVTLALGAVLVGTVGHGATEQTVAATATRHSGIVTQVDPATHSLTLSELGGSGRRAPSISSWLRTRGSCDPNDSRTGA